MNHPHATPCSFFGQAESAAQKILDAFQNGTVAGKIAPVFIHRRDGVPCREWSWNNQILTILSGTTDARGFRQWQEIGRFVKKGAKAFYILVPVLKKIRRADANGIEHEFMIPVAFKSAPVFRLEDTDGAPVPVDSEILKWIDSLPLVDVARAWGINVDAFNGGHGKPLGKFIRRGSEQAIGLGEMSLSTWAHEFMHAADARLGNLKEYGQHWRSETVAELGATVLLEVLGYTVESNRAGAWDYIQKYAIAAGIAPVAACMDVLKRTCDAVNLILTEAEKLNVTVIRAA